MDLIGATASIIALAQVGFSLAKALNSYVGEVSDAKRTIIGVSNDIIATCRELNTLHWVLEQNKRLDILTDDALENANSCVRDADVVIKQLTKLFRKSGATDTGQVTPDQLDITKLRKLRWPMYKSELETRRAELQTVKMSISLVHTAYIMMAGTTSVERQQATQQLPLLYNTVEDLKGQVVHAREKRDKIAQQQSRSGARTPHRPQASVYASSEDGEVMPAQIKYDSIEKLYMEFDQWAKLQEQRKKAAETEKKAAEEAIIKAYVRAQEEIRAKELANRKLQRDALQETLTRSRLAPTAIEDILEDAYPLQDLPLQRSDLGDDTMRDAQHDTGKKSAGRPKLGLSHKPASHVNKIPPVLGLLQDSLAPGGIAELKTICFQRMLTPDGYQIVQFEAGVPEEWLAMKKHSSQQDLGRMVTSDAWGGFAHIPEDYRYKITSELRNYQKDPGMNWILLHVEALKAEKKRRKFGLIRKDVEIVGAYVVLRKVSTYKNITTRSSTGTSKVTEVTQPLTDNSDLALAYAGPSAQATSSAGFPQSRTKTESIADLRPTPTEAQPLPFPGPTIRKDDLSALRFGSTDGKKHAKKAHFAEDLEVFSQGDISSGSEDERATRSSRNRSRARTSFYPSRRSSIATESFADTRQRSRSRPKYDQYVVASPSCSPPSSRNSTDREAEEERRRVRIAQEVAWTERLRKRSYERGRYPISTPAVLPRRPVSPVRLPYHSLQPRTARSESEYGFPPPPTRRGTNDSSTRVEGYRHPLDYSPDDDNNDVSLPQKEGDFPLTSLSIVPAPRSRSALGARDDEVDSQVTDSILRKWSKHGVAQDMNGTEENGL